MSIDRKQGKFFAALIVVFVLVAAIVCFRRYEASGDRGATMPTDSRGEDSLNQRPSDDPFPGAVSLSGSDITSLADTQAIAIAVFSAASNETGSADEDLRITNSSTSLVSAELAAGGYSGEDQLVVTVTSWDVKTNSIRVAPPGALQVYLAFHFEERLRTEMKERYVSGHARTVVISDNGVEVGRSRVWGSMSEAGQWAGFYLVFETREEALRAARALKTRTEPQE